MNEGYSYFRRYREEEYLRFADIVKPYPELVDGYLVEKYMGGWQHAIVVPQVAFALWQFCRAEGAGKVLTYGRVRFPRPDGEADHRVVDLAYYMPHLKAGDPTGLGCAIPSLTIEVKDDAEPLDNLRERCRWFRAHGVATCWAIDPDLRILLVFNRFNDGAIMTGDQYVTADQLPGFELSLDEVFSVLDRE